MRLLYLMTEPFGYGGVQSDLLTLSQDLTARGHTIYVATTTGVLLEELKSRGAIHVDLDFRFRGPLSLWSSARALGKFIRDADLNVIAPQSVRSAIVTRAALALTPAKQRPPVVVTIHNIHSPRHFGYVGRILNNCADFVIFESRYEYGRVVAGGLPAAKATIVHSGIDTEHFRPVPPDRELRSRYGLDGQAGPIFGIVARLSEEKGHRFLVEAFANVAKALPAARLLVIGDGPLLDEVKSQVASLDLQGRVIFTGAQRDVSGHLALLDVFVLSSTRESFPLAAREAMAAGKAVVAPDIGGCPEVVDDGQTGLLFAAGNVPELTQRMLQAAKDRLYRQLGAAGRERAVRLFSRRAWVDGDERVYRHWARSVAKGA